MASFNIWYQRKQSLTLSGLFQNSFLTFCWAFWKKAFLLSDRLQVNLKFMGLWRATQVFLQHLNARIQVWDGTSSRGKKRAPQAMSVTWTAWHQFNHTWWKLCELTQPTGDEQLLTWFGFSNGCNFWIFFPFEPRCQNNRSKRALFKSSCTFCHKCNIM